MLQKHQSRLSIATIQESAREYSRSEKSSSRSGFHRQLRVVNKFNCERKRGFNVIIPQFGIVLENLLNRLSGSKRAKNVLHHDARSANHGLPMADVWIHFDAIVHCCSFVISLNQTYEIISAKTAYAILQIALRFRTATPAHAAASRATWANHAADRSPTYPERAEFLSSQEYARDAASVPALRNSLAR
jgi:hypothetical protein